MNPFIIKRPVVTEKSYRIAQAHHAYTFLVEPKATKGQITSAIEQTFNVRVLKIQTTSLRGKTARTGSRRMNVQLPARKKAIVTIPQDQTIDIFEALNEKKESKK